MFLVALSTAFSRSSSTVFPSAARRWTRGGICCSP
jgi:hypothetical protein